MKQIIKKFKKKISKFFKKKQKKVLRKVIVYFYSYYGGMPVEHSKRIIIIPKGWDFQIGFAKHPTLIDKEGNVRKAFDWQAGYEVVYEFIYKGGGE